MILGILSDTHSDKMNALPHIIAEMKKRGVEHIIHCGDIEPQHVNPKLFSNIPVTCALNEEQYRKIDPDNPPEGWKFTKSGDRIVDIGHTRCYVGHKLSFHLVANPETGFIQRLEQLGKDNDGLRWVFAGHTHHQILVQIPLVYFINPGAIEITMDGYEFAIVDTETNEVVYSRIPKTKPVESSFSVGIISDSLWISKKDSDFWKKLRLEFEKRGVAHVIHCGNIASGDIGLEEFKNFTVHYHLRDDQLAPRNLPHNWQVIPKDKPLVVINDRWFYVHPLLARILLEETEADMHKECLKVLELYPEVSFILYGGTNDAFLSEGQRARIINPGDVLTSRNFAVICIPKNEITFGHVPLEPLPPIETID